MQVSPWDGLKIAVLLFVGAVAQVSIFSQIDVFGATPDLLLVTLVAISLLRGSIAGAAGGFFAGLIVDTAALGTLGLTSLVLTLAGFSIGRYGETTGRDRAHAPYLSIAVVTVLYEVGLLVVHFVLGESAPAGALFASLVPAVILNLLLTGPVYALVRRLLRPQSPVELSAEVQLLG
jgi:rod shape-determining protein MreD